MERILIRLDDLFSFSGAGKPEALKGAGGRHSLALDHKIHTVKF